MRVKIIFQLSIFLKWASNQQKSVYYSDTKLISPGNIYARSLWKISDVTWNKSFWILKLYIHRQDLNCLFFWCRCRWLLLLLSMLTVLLVSGWLPRLPGCVAVTQAAAGAGHQLSGAHWPGNISDQWPVTMLRPHHHPDTGDTADPPVSKTMQYKKITKPLLERKRRARINACLDELKVS